MTIVNLLLVLAGFLTGWSAIGTVVVFFLPEGQWAGVPRWQAILTWPLAFVKD